MEVPINENSFTMEFIFYKNSAEVGKARCSALVGRNKKGIYIIIKIVSILLIEDLVLLASFSMNLNGDQGNFSNKFITIILTFIYNRLCSQLTTKGLLRPQFKIGQDLDIQVFLIMGLHSFKGLPRPEHHRNKWIITMAQDIYSKVPLCLLFNLRLQVSSNTVLSYIGLPIFSNLILRIFLEGKRKGWVNLNSCKQRNNLLVLEVFCQCLDVLAPWKWRKRSLSS